MRRLQEELLMDSKMELLRLKVYNLSVNSDLTQEVKTVQATNKGFKIFKEKLHKKLVKDSQN